MRRIIWPAVALCLALAGIGVAATHRWGSGTAAARPGGALVIDAEANAEAELPALNDLLTDPQGVAGAYRSQGLVVAADPSGGCLAVCTPVRLDAKAVGAGGLSELGLAACLLQGATSEQLGLRQEGYLPLEALGDLQRKALLEIVRRGGPADPREADAHLAVGIWQSWDVYIVTQANGEPLRRRLFASCRPPTREAVSAAPLGGSPLYWVWPYAEASWGSQTLSIPAGTYKLDEILGRLSQAAGAAFTAPGEECGRRIAVVAQDVPVRSLLWAVAAARGLRPSSIRGGDPGGVRIELRPEVSDRNGGDGLRPMTRGTYYSARRSAASVELLSRLQELPTDSYWVAWRYADLPLLYRNLVAEGWQSSFALEPGGAAPPLDPDHTIVLWMKAILVSVELQTPGRGGTGREFALPAL